MVQQKKELYGSGFSKVFKTITADNGTEFARLSEIESWGDGEERSLIYFAHPYPSSERAQNEGHNRYLRWYQAKGESMDDVLAEDIIHASDTINSIQRKILAYRTSEELFDEQPDRIYALK